MTHYLCVSGLYNSCHNCKTYAKLNKLYITAQEGPGIVIVHPAGQDVELLCTVMTSSSNEQVAWQINHGTPYTVSGLPNGIVTGYSANGNNLIVENIMINDDRNDTEYRCVITTQGTRTILRQSDSSTILYVAGEYISAILYMYVFYGENFKLREILIN